MSHIIRRRPVEIFGHHTDAPVSPDVKKSFADYYCPFIKGECKKPRKSDPDVKIGTCTLGYKGAPVIVCPHRFVCDDVFSSIVERYVPAHFRERVKWVREVSIGKSGSVDYVATVYDGENVIDFLCVEFQAGGTTGTPWPAVEEYVKNGKFSRQSYKYGINWANEYLKTMMQQVLKKGKIVDSWKRKIIFVLQDVGMDYIVNSGAGIKAPGNPEDPVQFLPFNLEIDALGDKYELNPCKKTYSATLDGIVRILGGSEEIPSEDAFKSKIIKKGIKDNIFKSGLSSN